MQTKPAQNGYVPSRGSIVRRRIGITLRVIEKLLLPAALGALTFFGVRASNAINEAQAETSKRQVEVAELQLERAKVEADATLQLKYVELFYKDLTAPELARKQAGLSLLSVMQPKLADAAARAIAIDDSLSTETRLQVIAAAANARRLGPLVNYRLVIYSDRNDAREGQRLAAELGRLGLTNTQVKPRPVVYDSDMTEFGVHVRHDDVYESEAGDYLINLMRNVLPNTRITKVLVKGPRTDGVITIFV